MKLGHGLGFAVRRIFTSSSPLLNSLKAYFDFNQTMNDISGNGNNFDAVDNNGASALYSSSTSPINKPYSYNNLFAFPRGYFSETNATGIINGALSFTIAFWVTGVSAPTTGGVNAYNLVGTSLRNGTPTFIPSIGIINSNTDPFGLFPTVARPTQTSFYFTHDYTDTVNGAIYLNQAISSSTAYFVVARYDNSSGNGTIKLTVNGTTVSRALQNPPVSYLNQGAIFQIMDGQPPGPGTYLPNNSNIFFDELGIWQRALTDVEITQLYNAGTGKFYPFS
jgi:hypothetical protein